MFKLTKDII